MSHTDLKPSKICRLCRNKIDGLCGFDYTCRTCQHECRRVEPLYRDLAPVFVEIRRENQFALKQLKDELAELKSSLSGRQQKASTTLKGLKDDIAALKGEMEAIRKCQSKAGGGGLTRVEEGLKKLEGEVKSVKESVNDLDQELSHVYAAKQSADEQDEEEAEAEREEMRETLEGLEDFTKRLKEAFVGLAGPERKVAKKIQEEEEKDRKELKQGMAELQGFMKQMQTAFSMFPVSQPIIQPAAPQPNGVNGEKAPSKGS